MKKFEQLSGSDIVMEPENKVLTFKGSKLVNGNLIGVMEYETPEIDAYETAILQRDGWERAALQYSEGMHYYMGLLDQIANSLGEEAFTADDGGLHDSPIRAKLPEMIAALVRKQHEH